MVPSIIFVFPLFLVMVQLDLTDSLRQPGARLRVDHAAVLHVADVGLHALDPDRDRGSGADRRRARACRFSCRWCCRRRCRASSPPRSSRMIVSWNDYLFGRVFINSLDNLTLTVGVMLFFEGTHVDWGLLMAASVLMTVPMAILFMAAAAPSRRRLRRRCGEGLRSKERTAWTSARAHQQELRRGAGSEGHRSRLSEPQVRHPAGPIGLRQDHAAAHDRRARAGDRRRRSASAIGVVNDLAPRDRNIAMVFQYYALYPQMTVRRNIGYGLRVRGTPKAEIDAAVERVARHSGDRPSARPQAGAALRRPAPARGARARHGAPARHLPHGRAALESRRQAARHHARRN